MFVIMEGFDKTGKTTLMKHMGVVNQWREVYIDRGPVGYIFYDEILCRTTNERLKEYKGDAQQLSVMDCIVVFCTSDPSDIVRRHVEHNEDCILCCESDITKAQDRYLELIDAYYDCPTVVLNTSLLSIEQCGREIEKFVKIVKQKKRKIAYV